MDELCEICWNTDCKSMGEEHMQGKLPYCKFLEQHPELSDPFYVPPDEKW